MEEDDMPRLTAADATRANALFFEREHNSHNRHVRACKGRLQRFIRDHPEQTFLVYQVPMVVVGSALREAKSVINHMIHALRADGFDAAYLGSNLIFISWRPATPNPRHAVKDYVRHAQMGFPATRSRTRVVPLTSENLAKRGPGPPVAVSDVERTKMRMDREISKRLQQYEKDNHNPSAERRRHFDHITSHEDALRSVVNRTTL